jgi:beta-phosphoglucomutase-like phosphatase (HAD superfamily)
MMAPPPVTPLAVVFDFDGVLVSTTGVWDRAYAALFAHWSRRLDRDDRRWLATLPLADLGPALARLLGNPAPPHDLATHLFELISTNAGMPITVVAGAAELVGAVRPRGTGGHAARAGSGDGGAGV